MVEESIVHVASMLAFASTGRFSARRLGGANGGGVVGRPSRTNKRIRVGVIGVGYWGRHYLRIVDELLDADLIWACDIEERTPALSTAKLLGARTTCRASDVIGDENLDAIIVATPPASHAAIVADCLSGGKHVLCEKPLALTSDACRALGGAAESAHRVLMVGHTYLYNPAIRIMRTLVSAGAIGDLVYLDSIRTGPGPIRDDVNVVWDLAPHDAAMFLYLTEARVVGVIARGACHMDPEKEDVAFLIVDFEDGSLGMIHVSWVDALKRRTIRAVGSRGLVVFDDLAESAPLRLVESGLRRKIAASRQVYDGRHAVDQVSTGVTPYVPPDEPLMSQVRYFIDCCRLGKRPVTDAAFAARVVAILEASSLSLRAGGRRMPL